MVSKNAASRFAALAVLGYALGFVASPALAQVSFYGAPPPADFGGGLGNSTAIPASLSEAEAPAPDDAAAIPAPSSGGSSDGKSSVGTGLFSKLPIDFTFAVREGYDDNLFTTKNDTDSSFYTNWAAGAYYTFGTPRLQLQTSLSGGVTYYYTRPGDKVDFNGQYTLNAVYLATPRLTLTVNSTTAYLSQPDTAIVGGTNRQDGDYMYSNTVLSGAYQWSEKFSTVTSYNFNVIYYMDSNLNQNQGRVDQTIGQSARWLVQPKTTAVAEYRANPVTYFDADLNVFNNFFLVGFDQVFNPRFTWSARGGLQVGFDQNPDDGDSVYVGPYGESTLTYQFGRSSSISWMMRYGTEASGLDNVTQRQTFRTGLSLAHAFTRRISMTLGVNYQANYYDQNNVITSYYENVFDVAVGASYQINRHWSLSAGYQFTADVAPDAEYREYTRNVVYVGANLAF